MSEAQLKQTDDGLVPEGDGWFVLNAKQARWFWAEGRPAACRLEGEPEFDQVGVNIMTLDPGVPMAMYHWEADQEDFLVLSGEAVAVVEGEERPLRQWDLLHCPKGVKHVIVGAGSGPCTILCIGARTDSMNEDETWGGYTVEPAAAKYGASVDEATHDPKVAYAKVNPRAHMPYRDGWLPEG